MNYFFITILLFCTIIYLIIRDRKLRNEKEYTSEKKYLKYDNSSIRQNTIYPYRKKYLLTKTEYFFYNELKNRIEFYKIIICPKVRLEDFVEVTDRQHIQKYRGYIKSRHVDFLLCDYKLHIIGAIELDDSSHNTSKAMITDNFKNNLFNTIGIKLFRISTKEDYAKQINDMLMTLVNSNPNIIKN